jgi:acylphosphatase
VTTPSTLHRLDAVFEGDVQGVGFRWTVLRIVGDRFPSVTGEIENLHDGTVRLAAEDTPGELRRLLDTILVSRLAPGIQSVRHAFTPIPRRRYSFFSPR